MVRCVVCRFRGVHVVRCAHFLVWFLHVFGLRFSLGLCPSVSLFVMSDCLSLIVLASCFVLGLRVPNRTSSLEGLMRMGF